MNPNEIERDMPEVEAEEKERKEEKKMLEQMMGEEYHKYFWNEKHAL